MSANTSSTALPSAPRLEELLEHHYGSEAGCDVIFLVGPSADNCLRIPAHSHILKNATPVFGAMFSINFFNQQQQPQAQVSQSSTAAGANTPEEINAPSESQPDVIPKRIPVPDLDGKAFDNLMKYLYDVPLILQSPETSIETLKAAHKYQCAGLVRKCVNHLIGLISTENVLLITANVAILCGDFQNLENLYMELTERESGADCLRLPQLIQRRLSEPSPELNIEMDCAWLVYTCLDFIDRNATTVLQSEEIEDLDYSSIYHIMSRDTLLVQESLVFDAITRWADKQCKRRHLSLTVESKREVLMDLIYRPRYLRMSSSDFLSGPVASGLLSQEEVSTLSHLIQIGPDTLAPVSPETSPYKRIQSLGIPAPQSLRIHLNYLLKPRKTPDDKKSQGAGTSGPSDGNWVARLKKMRCCLLCCESSGSGSLRPSRCTSPSILSSPVRRGSEDDPPTLPIPSGRGGRGENHKVGFVERAVVIFACLLD